MPDVYINCLKSVLVILIALQAAILLLRFPTCGSRSELLWFLLILALIGVHNLSIDFIPVQNISSFMLLWAIGSYLALICHEQRIWLWHCVLLLSNLIFLLFRALGYYGTLHFALLIFFSFELFSIYIFKLLLHLFRNTRSGLFFFMLIAVTLLFLSMGYDMLSRGMGLPQLKLTIWASFFYLAVSGYMLAQEAYLKGISWQGLYARLGIQEKRLQSAYSRLIQTENTLLLQDRLIAAGILSAGAAHEFKNVLSHIRTCAGYGLKRREIEAKDRSMELVLEHAELGEKAIIEFLDQLIDKGREAEEIIHLKADLKFLLDMVKKTYRREGICIIDELKEELCIMGRKGELEQVLLNLISNLVDSLKKETDSDEDVIKEEKIIWVKGWSVDYKIVLDVVDNGRGVPQDLGRTIFDFSVSAKSSTGLGLYLARMLISRNNGSLEYVPVDRGSCFRMIFPSAIG